jgi:hypothetical protein
MVDKNFPHTQFEVDACQEVMANILLYNYEKFLEDTPISQKNYVSNLDFVFEIWIRTLYAIDNCYLIPYLL